MGVSARLVQGTWSPFPAECKSLSVPGALEASRFLRPEFRLCRYWQLVSWGLLARPDGARFAPSPLQLCTPHPPPCTWKVPVCFSVKWFHSGGSHQTRMPPRSCAARPPTSPWTTCWSAWRSGSERSCVSGTPPGSWAPSSSTRWTRF